jgi:chaperonin GroEL
MAKKVFYDDDARKRVLGGAEILYNAVKTTMGPKGRNVVISKSYGNPTVTHDGVTVAKGVEIDDVDDETLGNKVGAELIKQAANKMNDVAGDGTTTVTVLTYHILNEANKLIAAGYNPLELRRGLEIAAADTNFGLIKLSEDIGSQKDRVAQVASISAGDKEIGTLIADVMEKVGKDGVVTVEEGQGLAMESEVVEGFTMDRGYISAYMVTDTSRMEAVYDKPAILITDQKISSIQDFLPMLEKLAQAGKKDLVLIADDVEGEALGTLVLNRLKGVFNTVAVKAPAFGDRRKDIMQDIAILTGGEVISEDTGTTFENADLSVIGTARKVIVTKDETTIIEGAGTAAAVKTRVAQINSQIDAASSEYDKENLEKRRAALSGKVAVIKVGGATETEIEEKKFRVDDAVAAVKAALEDGIVPGGGIAYLTLSFNMPPLMAGGEFEAEDPITHLKEKGKIVPSGVTLGKKILRDALQEPFKQLVLNTTGDRDATSELLTQLKQKYISLKTDKEKSSFSFGFDVNDLAPNKVIDLKDNGIVDPTRVVKEAVQNAVSIAGTAMTMGALVVEVPEKTPAAPMPDMGGMGMGM